MNTIDFKQAGGFPLTQDTLNFMQKANVEAFGALATAFATLCSNQYVILSGCEDKGFNNVSSGVVSINGEIMPFQEGEKNVGVAIVKEKTAVVYKDGSQKDAYHNKYAKFVSGGGEIPWSAFKRVPSSMPASDVYAWAKAAKKPSYTASEITDFPKSMPASDVSAWAKATTKPTYTAAEVGAVPNARKINNKQLSADITLTAADVGAAAASHTHTPASLGIGQWFSVFECANINTDKISLSTGNEVFDHFERRSVVLITYDNPTTIRDYSGADERSLPFYPNSSLGTALLDIRYGGCDSNLGDSGSTHVYIHDREEGLWDDGYGLLYFSSSVKIVRMETQLLF